MATIVFSQFGTLNGFTTVNTSPGGSITATGGAAVIDRTGAGTNDDDMGLYRTNAVTAVIGQVIYIDFKLSAITLPSGSHGYILLKDATGIAKSTGGTFQVGINLQGVNPTKIRTWAGAVAGGSNINMAADTWYTGRFTIDGAGDCQVDAKLRSDVSYTNIGTLAGITVAGASTRIAWQYRNDAEFMYVDNFFWTTDGTISPIVNDVVTPIKGMRNNQFRRSGGRFK